MTYDFGDQKVTFTSDSAAISLENHQYHVSWTVYMVNNSGLKKMSLSNVSYSFINSAAQHSAVLKANNSFIKIAEIFSFGTAIDASIAVKNLMKTNETYEIMFDMKSAKHHSIASMNGFDPHVNSIIHGSALSKTGFAMIPSADWSLSMGHVNVNWRNEMSIFHSGYIATSQDSSFVALPFGPVTLMENETYSIDPVIRPEVHSCPTCGGGNGGGGGSDSSFPAGMSSYIYDANGNQIGLISQSVDTQSEWETGVLFGPSIGASFSPESGSSACAMTVNSFVQDYCWIGNSAGSGYEMCMKIEDNFYQNHVDQNAVCMDTILTVITGIANAVGLPIPDLADFLAYSSGISTKTLSDGIQTSANAGIYYIPCTFGEYIYNTLGYSYGPWYDPSFQNSYMFGDHLHNEFEDTSVGGTQCNPVVNYFEYSVTMSVSNGLEDGSLFTGSSSMTFNIGQYNP